MNETLQFLQNVNAVAFLLLGVATAAGWAKRRDPSLGFLALAIVLLALVSLLGRVPASYAPPLLPQISLIAFMGSGYALLRFRGSFIPLSVRWHRIAVVALLAGSAGYLAAQELVAGHLAPLSLQTGAAIVLILVWSATILEPIFRFWLVARSLPAVQAWRLRALSFGFGGLVAVLLLAVGSSAFAAAQWVELVIQLSVLFIVPMLYLSFSPPAWLRRQWRSSEEEGLRAFMQDMLLLSEDPFKLARRALDWAMRLVGAAAAVAYDGEGGQLASRGLDPDQLRDLEHSLPDLKEGVSRSPLGGVDRTLFVLSITGTEPAGRLVMLAGPFTPSFGGDELSRVQQFMSAVAVALDRARLIEKLKQGNVELVEANRHKSEFMAHMSHELRTPLNAIIGFSELLMDSSKEQFSDATKSKFLGHIHASGKHLLGLINDILDLSKIEAGRMELRLQTVSVADVVDQVAGTVEPLAAQKQIHIEFDAKRAGLVIADEGKLKQMILNLVSNAIKFTAEGGTVTINAARAADRLEIVVSDNGIGIAEHDLERMFNEFQQVDSGVSRRQQGTGLGLALTRSFALLHGGDVRVESTLGKGSRFTIDIPAEASPPKRAPAAVDVSARAANGDALRPLVIIVEDDPVAAELLVRQIGRAGFRTMVARTGAEAVRMAKEHKPAAITLDIMLPDIDGWEVLTRLKGDDVTSEIPVVVVSAVDNPALGTAMGAIDYFVKPVEAKQLVDRLSNFNFKHKAGGRQTCVLVVDDEAANRDWLQHVLEPAGFAVELASGGKEGIEMARSRKPDVVMLDLLMPEVDGFEVVAAMGVHEATKAIPIMVLTAKHLTEADFDQLNDHVATVLKRGSVGAADVLGQLQVVLNKRGR